MCTADSIAMNELVWWTVHSVGGCDPDNWRDLLRAQPPKRLLADYISVRDRHNMMSNYSRVIMRHTETLLECAVRVGDANAVRVMLDAKLPWLGRLRSGVDAFGVHRMLRTDPSYAVPPRFAECVQLVLEALGTQRVSTLTACMPALDTAQMPLLVALRHRLMWSARLKASHNYVAVDDEWIRVLRLLAAYTPRSAVDWQTLSTNFYLMYPNVLSYASGHSNAQNYMNWTDITGLSSRPVVYAAAITRDVALTRWLATEMRAPIEPFNVDDVSPAASIVYILVKTEYSAFFEDDIAYTPSFAVFSILAILVDAYRERFVRPSADGTTTDAVDELRSVLKCDTHLFDSHHMPPMYASLLMLLGVDGHVWLERWRVVCFAQCALRAAVALLATNVHVQCHIVNCIASHEYAEQPWHFGVCELSDKCKTDVVQHIVQLTASYTPHVTLHCPHVASDVLRAASVTLPSDEYLNSGYHIAPRIKRIQIK